MNVKVIGPSDETAESNDNLFYLEIEIDGRNSFSVYDGELEDNNLSRNFNDCYKIADLMNLAYNAGKNGEPFNIEFVDD